MSTYTDTCSFCQEEFEAESQTVLDTLIDEHEASCEDNPKNKDFGDDE